MSQLFKFTSNHKLSLEEAETLLGVPQGSLDKFFGVVCVDPDANEYSVCCMNDSISPVGSQSFSNPAIGTFAAQRPAMGAMMPPAIAWQEGKTAGEISLIHFVMKVRTYFSTLDSADLDKQDLNQDANRLLKWYGVEK